MKMPTNTKRSNQLNKGKLKIKWDDKLGAYVGKLIK